MMVTAQPNLPDLIKFVGYIDRLKSVIRKNGLHDGSREENTAEHSWHAALSGMLLAPYANVPVDSNRVIKMLLVHDLIEIEAGDTFIYDEGELALQAAAEELASKEVIQRLPPGQAAEFEALWEEFEARQTPEARFAKAIDRFLPIYSDLVTAGFTWRKYQISRAQVSHHAEIIRQGSTALWEWVDQELDRAVKEGFLLP